MSDLIDRFCAWHHVYNAISDARARDQRNFLRTLEHEAGPLEQLTAADVRSRLSARLELGTAPTTIRKQLGLTKPFYRWLWHEGIIDDGRWMAFTELRPPRNAPRRGVPRPYSRAEVQHFWRELYAQYPNARTEKFDVIARWERGNVKWSKRIRLHYTQIQVEAIAALALYGGMRRDEIFRLEYEDMHYENSVVVARSRKNKRSEWRPRGVPMFTPMSAAVRAWFEARAYILARTEHDHDRPWISLYGPNLGAPWANKRFIECLHKVGRGWKFHRFRHTAATEMLRAGIGIEKVQKILGHASISETLGYAELVHVDLIDAAERADARYVSAIGRQKEEA